MCPVRLCSLTLRTSSFSVADTLLVGGGSSVGVPPPHSSPPSPSLLALGRKLPRPPLLAIVVTPHYMVVRLRLHSRGLAHSALSARLPPCTPLAVPCCRNVRSARRDRPAGGGCSSLVSSCLAYYLVQA